MNISVRGKPPCKYPPCFSIVHFISALDDPSTLGGSGGRSNSRRRSPRVLKLAQGLFGGNFGALLQGDEVEIIDPSPWGIGG
jgi:hypothetical protein